jgi:hypothetical protein
MRQRFAQSLSSIQECAKQECFCTKTLKWYRYLKFKTIVLGGTRPVQRMQQALSQLMANTRSGLFLIQITDARPID